MSDGRFATKAGANDSTDLQYDSLSETEFHENELEQFSRELPCKQGNYFTTGGGFAHPPEYEVLLRTDGVKPERQGAIAFRPSSTHSVDLLMPDYRSSGSAGQANFTIRSQCVH